MAITNYMRKLMKHGLHRPVSDYLSNPIDADQIEFHSAQHAAMNIPSTSILNNTSVLYVNTKNTTNGIGTILSPFNLVQTAINAATDFTTIKITTGGDHFENLVMRDLNGVAFVGDSEMNTSIVNVGNSHTFSWVAGAVSGALCNKFSLNDIEFVNTDTTGTYHALHIDGNAVVYPNTFLGTEFDINLVDIEGSGVAGQTTAYFRNTGIVHWTHGQVVGGDLEIKNVSIFRTRQLEIGTLVVPTNLVVEYNGNNPRNGLGRNDNTLAEQSIVWGNLVLLGHPIFQCDKTSIITGTTTGTLTSFYASGRDYCPTLVLYGQFGIVGYGGNITLQFPDPQISGSAFNFVDMSYAHVLGTVSFTKTNFLPATTRGYAIITAPAQFDTSTVAGISANGFVALDLRGATFKQSVLSTSGAASIDRDVIAFNVATPTVSTSVSIVPPLPLGATYTVSACPTTAIAYGVSSKTISGFTLLLATGGGTTDVTLHRI